MRLLVRLLRLGLGLALALGLSGAALAAAGKAGDLKEGIAMAAAAIDTGKASGKLDALIRYTQENG